MKTNRLLIAAFILGAAPLPLLGAERAPAESLGRYIPSDVFVFVGKAHTSEHEFVEAHWARVFRALCSCGIEREVHNAISTSLEGEDRAKFEATWDKLMGALKGVQWGDLPANEVAIGERISGLFPDWFFLARPKAETLEDNVRGLAEVMRTLASFDTGGNIEYQEREERGIHIWSIDFRQAPIGFCLLRKGDIVGVVAGLPGRADCIALLSGDKGVTAIVDSPRFRSAVAELPAAEHAIGFVDINRLMGVLRRLPMIAMGMAQQHLPPHAEGEKDADCAESKAEVDVWLGVFASLIDMVDVMDYIAFTGRMEGEQEITETISKIKPTASKSPLYNLVASQKPVEAFQRYMPVETMSFSASSFVDPGACYGVIKDFVVTKIPNGETGWKEWERIQSEISFNIEEDLLSWLGGEFITITIPRATPSPFGGEDGVVMMRVKDPELARAKLSAGLDRLVRVASEYGQVFQADPTTSISTNGFRQLVHPVTAGLLLRPCIGVWDNWLVFGASEHAVEMCIQTARGQHDTIAKNARFRAEGLPTDSGNVYLASFTDMSKMGEQLTSAFIGLGFFGASIPENRETRPMKAMIRALGSLGPVFNEINFISSKCDVTTFENDTWHTTTKFTYKSGAKSTVSE
ncbi:MAG: hypothetical protein H6817_04690 [Phycisphaerales bacterium]|nr:hypothetical protein [Phycisphaerales bacterium]